MVNGNMSFHQSLCSMFAYARHAAATMDTGSGANMQRARGGTGEEREGWRRARRCRRCLSCVRGWFVCINRAEISWTPAAPGYNPMAPGHFVIEGCRHLNACWVPRTRNMKRSGGGGGGGREEEALPCADKKNIKGVGRSGWRSREKCPRGLESRRPEHGPSPTRLHRWGCTGITEVCKNGLSLWSRRVMISPTAHGARAWGLPHKRRTWSPISITRDQHN